MHLLKVMTLSVIFSMTLLSCKKNINGCTDSTADNFNFEANVENGSCNYHGTLTPWYDTITRDSLLANNIASVTFYVDNETLQNIDPNFIIWSSVPDCSSETIGNWVTMQGSQSKSISLTAKAFDGSNVVVRNWSQSLTINASECKLYKLIW